MLGPLRDLSRRNASTRSGMTRVGPGPEPVLVLGHQPVLGKYSPSVAMMA